MGSLQHIFPSEKKIKSKIVTIALPDVYVNDLLTLENFGVFPSRSEAIRTAVYRFLVKESKTNEQIERFKETVEAWATHS